MSFEGYSSTYYTAGVRRRENRQEMLGLKTGRGNTRSVWDWGQMRSGVLL